MRNGLIAVMFALWSAVLLTGCKSECEEWALQRACNRFPPGSEGRDKCMKELVATCEAENLANKTKR